MHCAHCGATLDVGDGFCPRCGAAATPTPPATCPTCRAAVPRSAAFCPACGAELRSGAPSPFVPTGAPAPPPHTPAPVPPTGGLGWGKVALGGLGGLLAGQLLGGGGWGGRGLFSGPEWDDREGRDGGWGDRDEGGFDEGGSDGEG